MIAPAARIARGIIRRGCSISSPIVDALSTPPNANAIVDQKMTSLRLVFGTNARAGIGVADPKRDHDRMPSTRGNSIGTQLATAPTVFSHVPTFNPTTLSVTARTSPRIATMMEDGLVDDSGCDGAAP